jgi:hypothetical protein
MSKPVVFTTVDCGVYKYIIHPSLELHYKDDCNQLGITFGSKEQMIAVAQAVLEIASKV